MEMDLAQVAAGLPMALSLALAGGITSFREGRRRSALNEAMHELRRPLQALSLASPTDPARAGALDSSLRMAAAALERLDCEINGAGEAGHWLPLNIDALAGSAAKRWEALAAADGRSLRVHGQPSNAIVLGDRVLLAQAVDNLISNAFSHGIGAIAVEIRLIEKHVRIAVLDEGPQAGRGGQDRPGLRERFSGRCRHGHGLRVVGRAARAHGGTFRMRQSSAGTEARLELPLDRSEAGG